MELIGWRVANDKIARAADSGQQAGTIGEVALSLMGSIAKTVSQTIYHVWNEGEHKAYRSYLNDQHKEYREWRTVKGPEQQQYFRWRHTHPDAVIVVK